MTIEMQKFGTILNSRPAGREAFLAFRPQLLHALKPEETITLDFQHVQVLTPSFADEFVTPLVEQHPEKIAFQHTTNITVQKTLEFLSEDWPERSYEWKER